jgi:hypothetical protein
MQVLVATDLVSEELKISFLSLGIDVCFLHMKEKDYFQIPTIYFRG